MATTGNILALDVGSARVGMALASSVARLASPAGTLVHDPTIYGKLRELCAREHVSKLVIGLPRGMSGQDTDQTRAVRAFGEELGRELALPVAWQDEALTSANAEDELRGRGRPFDKADIDSLAATYILEDYLREDV